jgi:hypothetical protein
MPKDRKQETEKREQETEAPATVECPVCHRHVKLAEGIKDGSGHPIMEWHFLPHLMEECHGSQRSVESVK